jgi:hypothetical protein
MKKKKTREPLTMPEAIRLLKKLRTQYADLIPGDSDVTVEYLTRIYRLFRLNKDNASLDLALNKLLGNGNRIENPFAQIIAVTLNIDSKARWRHATVLTVADKHGIKAKFLDKFVKDTGSFNAVIKLARDKEC